MTMTMIDAEQVQKAFLDCQVKEPDGNDELAVIHIKGTYRNFALSGERLMSHREQVREWLASMPAEFHLSKGGGWSFLNACQTADDIQWTSFHERVEQLVVLGIALGFVSWPIPRDVWYLLPGSMPYFAIDLETAREPGS